MAAFICKKENLPFGAVIFYGGRQYQFAGSDDDTQLVEMRNVAGEIRGAEKAISFALEQGAQILHIYHEL